MNVSIVTGTYNRIHHLKRMVHSVRDSVSPLKYEIVLVDGGSTDGTIKWCRKQEDVVLIEQGELLGAVKAFNAGAYAARGDYVILANDDIEFVGSSILRAFSFMQDFDDVGVGCFYQDRGSQNWHVEQMPAISPGGLRVSVPYGQVCIVPRWLGNYVGWWGTYLHTYGGDNELSCNIIELGYAVAPIKCACIHDMRVEDGLRLINKGDPAQIGGMHPDTRKWTRKWTIGGKTGPKIRISRHVQSNISIERQKRIFYAPIYEPGHQLQRRTKVGLRKALEKVGIVHECDYVNIGVEELAYEACSMCPDLFVLQIQDANTFNEDVIDELKVNHPNAKFVSWNGDYHPKNLYDDRYIEMMRLFDHAGYAVASIKDLYLSRGVNWFYWQIGYEEVDDEEETEIEVQHDVVFLGNGYSEDRNRLAKFLLDLRDTGLNVGLYGDWPKDWSMGSCLYDFDEGYRIYRSSRLAISDQQWPSATGYVSNRLFQAMAAGGCLVLQQRFDGMEEYLGLAEDTHLVGWDNFQDLEDEIRYFLDDEDMRGWIAQTGHEYMLEHHSFDRRVKELMSVLNW